MANDTETFEVEELDDEALDGVSGGDDNYKCTINSVAGCGAPAPPAGGIEPIGTDL